MGFRSLWRGLGRLPGAGQRGPVIAPAALSYDDVHVAAVNKQPVAFALAKLPDNIKMFQICYGIIDSFRA